MTEPTNKELDAVITHYRTRIYPQGMQPHFERAIMRAVLAKWGTPQPTQPQAEATPHCPDCGTHEVSIHKVCHNSACSKYGAEVTVHKGWKTPPKAQPATACKQRPIAYVDGDDAVRRILWEPNQAAFDIAVGTKLYAYQSPADAVDAERYRWLRRWKGQEHEPPFTVQHEIDGTLWGGDLDAAIDAERASHGQAPAQPAPAAVAGPSEFPHEKMDAVALGRYKVVSSDQSMFYRFAVVAGDGTQQLYIGREVDCQNMARKFAGAFLDGAFAYHSMTVAPTTQPSPAAQGDALDAARWRWLSEHIQVAWNEGKFTSLARIVSEQHRQSINASVDRMMAGDWSDADAARAAQEGGWMPIETAPKDSGYLLLRGGREQDVASGYWLQAAYAGNGAWIWPFVHMTPRFWAHLPPTSAEGVEHG